MNAVEKLADAPVPAVGDVAAAADEPVLTDAVENAPPAAVVPPPAAEATMPADDAPVVPAGVGDRLRAAREACGLSVADIAQALKFSPRQVELVEANAWSQLPGNTFVRGCVRNYARMLRIDPQPLMDELAAADLPKAPVLALPGSTNATLPTPGHAKNVDLATILGGLLLLCIALAAFFFVPESLWRGKSESPQKLPLVAVPVAPPAPTAVTAPPAANAAPAPASAEPVLPPADVAQPGVATLRFEFDQASWVEVRDSNGTLLHSQNNAAGTMQEVRGPLPLAVVIGDARRVRMIYRDKPVELAAFTNPQSNVARLNIE